MNRKLLHITFANSLAYTGGGQGTEHNKKAIRACLGDGAMDTYTIKPYQGSHGIKFYLRRISEILKGYMGGLTQQHLENIIAKLNTGEYTDVFIDSSQLGYLAKAVRKKIPHMCIYTFFQNMEYDFFSSSIWDGKDYLHAFMIPMAKYNERCACRYSDKIIVFNSRDASRVKAVYHRDADMQIPIWLTDDYIDNPPSIPAENGAKQALFVGSYFFGNTQGLKWFCKEVLPHVDMHLTIVGSGMDAFANDVEPSDKLSIYSNVPDLKPYYEQADFVILPVTTGGGMKVKTAETLKYGKYIIGTKESLEGYDVNPEIATVCNTAAAFIEAIGSYQRPFKFNPPSRQLFRQKYSYDAVISSYANLLNVPTPQSL
jgi:glycosyltransferase involved in cell wall biosynthesis